MNAHHSTSRSVMRIFKTYPRRYLSSPSAGLHFGKYNYPNNQTNPFITPKKTNYDIIIVGGGHNGLVAAAYLAKSGLSVLVLERRDQVGGAAVTEEVFPGYKFSRASYLAGLLRPSIIEDLNLRKYGFKYIPRDPSSFTPTLKSSQYKGKYLILGSDDKANQRSIAQFSTADAEAYLQYELFLGQVRDILQPILDSPPPNLFEGGIFQKLELLKTIEKMVRVGIKNREVLVPFYELFVGPANTILNRWFESDILKTTLATDAVIGAMTSPSQNGSAYVLLHHVMGEADGRKGVWAYVEGGMGAVSDALASSAKEFGAHIHTNAVVDEILIDDITGSVTGVRMNNGSVLNAKTVISATSPYHTFVDLIASPHKGVTVPLDFYKHIESTELSCGAFKINMVVDRLPNFECYPSPADGSPGPMHSGTVHFECTMAEIERAYHDTLQGRPAERPVIEMTIPSALDKTLAPEGKHIVQLFIQYAPYDLAPGVGSWADPSFKEAFVNRCLNIVEEYCPGFRSSILHIDSLSPLDLEQIFGLPKGNIHHGSLSLHQLAYMRPAPGYSGYRSPVKGLYLCSCGTHPGGGVMGAPGRNCAQVVRSDLYK